MKTLLPLLLCALWVGSAAAETPASITELFATPENLRIVRSADKVDVCLLRHIAPVTRANGSIDRGTERYEETPFVAVPASTAAALRGLLLSGKTYDWKASSGGRRPQFYLRLRFHRGEEAINIDFCFACHVLSVTRHGEEIGHANFGHASDLFLQKFLTLFPEDVPLHQAAKEAGLPL